MKADEDFLENATPIGRLTFPGTKGLPAASSLEEEVGVEGELASHREADSLHGEFRRIEPGPEQRSAVQGSRKKEMDGGARACSGKLDFERGNGAVTGLKRRAQGGASSGRDREGLETNEAGLLEFYGDDVAIRRKPRRRRLECGESAFAELLKPRKCLGHGSGRLPAHEEGSGGRKPRGRIGLARRINRRFDSPLLQAVSVCIDGVWVAVVGARGNAEARLILPLEEHHNFHLGPGRAAHQLEGLFMRPLAGRLLLPEIVGAGEWRQSE